MEWKSLRDIFNSSPGGIIGEENEYRSYAVMMPIIKREGKLKVMFEVRSATLRTDPGEICFPGGGIDKGEDARQAVLREVKEELGIEKSNIELAESEDLLITQNNRIIHAFCGYISENAFVFPSPDEVQELFYVPIEYFIENEPDVSTVCINTSPVDELPFRELYGRNYCWRQGKSRVYFYRYDNYIIWGITAKILYHYIQKIKSGRI